MRYNPAAWYWRVADDDSHVFSSATGTVVLVSDATYQTWVAAGGTATRIVSFVELYDVLQAQAPAAATLAAQNIMADLSPAQALGVLLASGAVISSTGTPSLNGTYSVDPGAQQKITAIATGIAAGKGLPGGGGTVGILDSSGTPHSFSSAAFLNFASAVEAYVYALYTTEATLLADGSADWPSRTLSIA